MTGGDASANRTFTGNVEGGRNSLCMASGKITLGKGSVGVRTNENGEIIAVIINKLEEDSEIELIVDCADKLENRVY